MQNILIKIVGAVVLSMLGISGRAQDFTITADKPSGSCGNQQVNFEAGFIEVGTTHSFDEGQMPEGWSSSPYNLGMACTGIFADTPDNSNYFWATINDENDQRYVATNDLNLLIGGEITFSMRFGRDDPSSGCENPDEPNEGVYLQFSTDGGAAWKTIKYWVPTQIGTLSPEGVDLYSWSKFSVTIPDAAKSNSTRFRWFQPSNSGSSYDNWGLDDISVFVLKQAETYSWEIGNGDTYDTQMLNAGFDTSGPKTISCTVTDAQGRAYSNTLTYEVIVDTEAPEAKAKNYFMILDENGKASLIADYLDGGSSDNCSELKFSVDKEAFSCADLGDNLVTLTVRDNAGNTATDEAIVSIYDFTAPKVVTKDITIELDQEGKASVRAEQIDGGSKDACSDRLTLDLNLTEFDSSNLGENEVTLTATDASGNKTSAKATITVVDNIAPTGYTVDIKEYIINTENQNGITFSLFGAEVGSQYTYTIQSENGEEQITESGSVVSGSQQFTGVDVRSLLDGEVFISVYLTDASGNSGEEVSASVYKDTQKPTVSLSTSDSSPEEGELFVNVFFSEAISDFTIEDVVLENATLSEIYLLSSQSYLLALKPKSEGLVTVGIAEGGVIDAAENTNHASELLSLTFSTTNQADYDFAEQPVDVSMENVFAYGFSLKGLTVGSTLHYSINSLDDAIAINQSIEIDEEEMEVSGVNLISLIDGALKISLYEVDKLGNQGKELSANIQKITIDIESVVALEAIEVPFSTSIHSIDLPKKIHVHCSDGSFRKLNVNWSTFDLKINAAGTYTLEGEIVTDNCLNSKNLRAEQQIIRSPNLAPTQITLSSNTFSLALAEQSFATFTTLDADDDEHTYALVNGDGDADNAWFSIIDDALYLNSIRGLSGQQDFSIRVRSTDPQLNTIEQVFTLNKKAIELSHINIINSFSPNGDGINELWVVPDLMFFDDVLIEVYDRAGRRVFQTTDPAQGWDGYYQGSIKDGGYYYLITINDIQLSKRGVLSVIK